jgi:hypothetical protein
MRLPLFLALAVLFPGVAQAEEAMCEYRHPDRPGWDFFAACTVEETASEAAVTLRASVVNGSRFTIEHVAGTDGMSATVNGLAARRLAREDARCYQTEAEAELICVHPRNATPGAMAGPATPVPTTADAGFGGGQAGFCLLTARNGGVETLTEYGPCVKRENCVASDAGGTTCLTDYDWKSGRLTEMARTDDWQTLDGATVDPGESGCFIDAPGGTRFCFSRNAMTAAEHPVLATVTP